MWEIWEKTICGSLEMRGIFIKSKPLFSKYILKTFLDGFILGLGGKDSTRLIA